jgi:Cu2+-exporting ATPase
MMDPVPADDTAPRETLPHRRTAHPHAPHERAPRERDPQERVPRTPVPVASETGLYGAYVRSLSGSLKEADLIVQGIRCAGCVQTIEHGLKRSGARDALVNYGNQRASVVWDEREVGLGDLLQALRRLGYDAHPYDPNVQERVNRISRRWALTRLGVAGFGAGNSMLYAVGLYAGYFYGMDAGLQRLFQALTGLIAVPVLFFSGWPFLRGAWGALRGRRLNMDCLISLGLLSAFCASWVTLLGFPGRETYFDSVVMGIFVLLIGRSLETLARVHSGNLTEGLLGLQVRWATRLEDGGERVVPIGDVRAGDRLVVRMGEAFPADGVVLEGETEVDESAITGESRRRAVQPGDGIVGATLNTSAVVVMESRRVGADTVLAKIARLVDLAQQRKAPVQRLADRVAGHFAVGVLALALAALAFWLLWAPWAPPQPPWVIAIAVLIIACPCGLGLATPLAVIAAGAIAAQRGILIKGGEALEQAARVTDVVLDKTGTLTVGGLSLTGAWDVGSLPRERWLGLAAALERRVVHPIAAALSTVEITAVDGPAAAGTAADGPAGPAADVRMLPGRGAMGTVASERVLVGNARLLAEQGLAVPAWPAGDRAAPAETVVYVAIGGDVAGILTLTDPLRADAAEAIAGLAALGLRVHLFSGDSPSAVGVVARRLGIEDARGGMLPDEKLEALAELQARGAVVAMVGDGINDAPALTRADVGIAVGTGSDLALEAAQVILMRPRLVGVLETLALSRQAFAVIRQNLALSVLYNACAVPLAVLGLVIPLLAAVSMSLSSLLVVLNALRLRLWLAPRLFRTPGGALQAAPEAVPQPGIAAGV